MFIKYCVFSKILKYISDSDLSRFPLGINVCKQWHVKHQHCNRTGRVQKNQNILRKNTIFNEHPVTYRACWILDTLQCRQILLKIIQTTSHLPFRRKSRGNSTSKNFFDLFRVGRLKANYPAVELSHYWQVITWTRSSILSFTSPQNNKTTLLHTRTHTYIHKHFTHTHTKRRNFFEKARTILEWIWGVNEA